MNIQNKFYLLVKICEKRYIKAQKVMRICYKIGFDWKT